MRFPSRILPWTLVTATAALLVVNAFAEQTGTPRRVLGAYDSTRRLAILGADGKVEWEHPVGPIHDAWVLPNGNILFQTNWTQIVELSPDKKIVWQYDAATRNGNRGKRVEVHAFQRLNNGLTLIAESGPARLIEVDADGVIQHEVRLRVDHPNPHSDTRLVRKLANGHYLVAHESDGCVREYDAQGTVVWEFEVPLFGKEKKGGHGPEAFGNSVYSAIRLPNGNTLIGTGNGHSVLEVNPAKEIVWKVEQNDLPGITLAWVTRVDRLPNGNTLIGNCHAGPHQPQFVEVTPGKKVVWTFKDHVVFGDSMPVQAALP
jgi:uncharacterized protein YndB with AHSA1/START domain